MIAALAHPNRNGKAPLYVAQAMLILTCVFMDGCSTLPDEASIAEDAGITEMHLGLARVEHPAGDPGNVMGGAPTLESQQEILNIYRDALYAALTSVPTSSRLATDCIKCPILTSRILAIDETMAPSKTELTVLFKLATPEQNGDVFWWKVIGKQGSSINLSGFIRLRHAREEAITEVLKELIRVLPTKNSTGQLGIETDN